MLDCLIFAGYLMLCVFGVLRSRFVRNSQLPARTLAVLLLLKITAGCLMGRYYQFQQNADSWGYHKDALIEYRLLGESPRAYFLNLFHSGYAHGYSGLLSTHDSFWNDLKNNSMVKLVSVLHFFSGGRYYVNVVLFNTLAFFGLLALYRLYRDSLPGRSRLLLLPVFLLPSSLLFGSLIHKDGVVLALLGFVCYFFNRICRGRRWFSIGTLLLAAMLFLFFLRNYVLAALLPALGAWYFAFKTKTRVAYWTFLFFGLMFAVFFFSGRLWPRADFLQYTVQKQQDFLDLEKGNTTVSLRKLEAQPHSFIKNLSEAATNGLVRPVWGDRALSTALLPFILEIAVCWGIFILFLFFRDTSSGPWPPFVLPLAVFAFLLCLFTGYIVPVLGAIVRYRAVYLPFILMPLLLGIDFNKIPKKLIKK